MEEEREKLRYQLYQSQKMDAIGQLAGGIAHDFNNILTVIQGNASIMMLKTGFDDPFYHRISQRQEQVTRGANLTRQLLGFARGGKYKLKTISLNDLIRKSIQFFVETRKEIKVDTDFCKDIYPVDADGWQLEQVLLNIFINAAHAMPGGGYLFVKTVNITVPETDAKSFETKPGDFVEISITDSGTGMDKNTVTKIFEPFFTTKGEQGGTGLGLTSAYGIIRNHGGSIHVYSEPGNGSTFTIYLPSSQKKVDAEEKKREKNILSGEGGILMIEDEPMIMEAVSDLLGLTGYTVYRASSGQEAVSIYMTNKKNIDLVILDMIMPGMNGSEVLKVIKKENPFVKVILTSGYSMQGEVQKVMDMGCDAFIQKPYNFSDFSNLVHGIIFRDENSNKK